MLKKSLSVLCCTALVCFNLLSLFACSLPGDTSEKEPSSSVSTENKLPTAPAQKPALEESDPDLRITEINIKNTYFLCPEHGQYHPWIELWAKNDLQLGQYTLSLDGSQKYTLPEKELKKGEYFLLCAELFNTPVKEHGTLTLMHGEMICQKLTYLCPKVNVSYLASSGGECTSPTPGYENALPSDDLLISELMCDNDLYPVSGVLCDWVELYNAGSQSLDLNNYWISDSADFPYMCRLPEMTLEAGEYALLRAGHELSFALSKDEEMLILTRGDGVLCSSLSYENGEENMSITREGRSDYPSPGKKNGIEGMKEYLSERTGVLINEVISSNSAYNKLSGEYYDMAELCNYTEGEISLKGLYLSDKAKEPKRYPLPDITLKSGQCYTVYCTGNGGDYPDFGISSKGEKLYITDEAGYIYDAFEVPALLHNISYGRQGQELVYFEKPTFGKVNSGAGFPEISAPAQSSAPSGFYNAPFEITLSGDGEIYYTADGSKPTLSSKHYEGESISVGQGVTNIRMICKKGALITSAESAVTYCVSLPEYTLPIIAVSVSHEEMFGENGTWTLEKKTEIEGHVSFFEHGVEQFSLGCGVKLFGNGSVTFPKKSLQLKFRGKYGASTLEYKMFDNLDISSFNSIVIRSGSQAIENCIINDEFVTSLISTTGTMPTVPVQAYKPCNLYINNEYMGVYFIREKLGDDYFASHLGVSPESVTMVYRRKYVECGSDGAEWKELWNYILEKDLRIEENYRYIETRFDFENVIDFMIAEMWCGNRDTLNMRVYKSSEGDGKWRYILYDLDRAFYYSTSGAEHLLGEYVAEGKPYNCLFYKLMQNDDFYARFNERLDFHMKNTFDPERSLAHFNFIVSQIEHDMVYEIERWKNETELNHNRTFKEWERECDKRRTRLTQAYNDAFLVALVDVREKLKKDESIYK